MRFLATLDGQQKTERFVAYLVSKDVSTHLEPNSKSPDAWDLWVRDEDRLAVAKSLLSEYEANPDDAKYSQAVGEAKAILSDQQKKKVRTAKQIRSRSEVFQQDLVGGRVPPITLTLLIIAIVVSLITKFGTATDENSYGFKLLNQLYFVEPAEYLHGSNDPAYNLKKLELWRVLTPIFIHLHPFHILFNGFILVSLGRLTERIEGTVRFALIVFLIAVISNLLQGLLPEQMMGNPVFGGLSGVTYGLFGYIWVKTTLNPSLGIALAPGVVVIMMAWLVLTIAGVINSNTANMAHLGGLLSGAGIAYLLTRYQALNRS